MLVCFGIQIQFVEMSTIVFSVHISSHKFLAHLFDQIPKVMLHDVPFPQTRIISATSVIFLPFSCSHAAIFR